MVWGVPGLVPPPGRPLAARLGRGSPPRCESYPKRQCCSPVQRWTEEKKSVSGSDLLFRFLSPPRFIYRYYHDHAIAGPKPAVAFSRVLDDVMDVAVVVVSFRQREAQASFFRLHQRDLELHFLHQ